MIQQFFRQLPSPVARLVAAETVIFTLVGAVSLLTRFHYSVVLTMAGCLIVIFRFLGNSLEGEQSLLEKPLVIGLIPLLAGLLLGFA